MLALIFLVMPGHIRFDLLEVYILTTQQHLAVYPLIPIIITVVHHNGFPGDQVGQVFLGLRAVCMPALRVINPLQPDFVLGLAGIEDHDGIAVCNTHDSPCQDTRDLPVDFG